MSAALAPEALAPPIADDLGLPKDSVTAVLRLLAAGDQPAFLARYRPERTGPLALRDLERIQSRATHAVAFEFRRQQLRHELITANRLDDEISTLLASATHLVELDDLRALLRKRKRGAAGKARARGLGLLASHLWACGSGGRMCGELSGSPQTQPSELAAQHPSRRPPTRSRRSASKKVARGANGAKADGEATESSDVAAVPSEVTPVEASEPHEVEDQGAAEAVDRAALDASVGHEAPSSAVEKATDVPGADAPVETISASTEGVDAVATEGSAADATDGSDADAADADGTDGSAAVDVTATEAADTDGVDQADVTATEAADTDGVDQAD
ncbi:MAG: hypothetical protein K0V04_05595, partial [Deltaproteobacteria bacterium]|nr:hypothetical protein [Deltaproteobacteria bacterium]